MNAGKIAGLAAAMVLIGWVSAAKAETDHHIEDPHSHQGQSIQDVREGAENAPIDTVFENYFAIQSSLANDSIEGIPARAQALAKAIEKLQAASANASGDENDKSMNTLMADIKASAESLAGKKNIDPARKEFGTLSEKLVDYQRRYGKTQAGDVRIFVCDMVKKPWLQNNDEIRNPYFGSAMLKCGRKLM
jgi:hypothetical protein